MKFLDFLNRIYLPPEDIISLIARTSGSKKNQATSNNMELKIIINEDGSIKINKHNKEVINSFNEASRKLAVSCK